ncbi:MAG TPA: hypothetical protein VE907_17045 [Gammaproteobacteria bacterium]|nr:hypothetical protein [Gammaproteobacteria bacterium]
MRTNDTASTVGARAWLAALGAFGLAATCGTAGAQPAATAPAACNRACLTGFVDAYFAALIANDAAKLPQAARARITENSTEKKLAATFWPGAESAAFRFDIVNVNRGDTGTEAVIRNADGTKTMFMLRLKVRSGAITEIETIKANEGEADRLWGPDQLTSTASFELSIRESERDSYYDLIAAAESYWRAFQTNGSPAYHPARLLPDSRRYENGLQTTGVVRNGELQTTARGFDEGRFLGRNIWDRRYPVVDEERGVALSIVRFGLKAGAKSQSVATSNDRLVAEFFAIKAGRIQEIQAVLFNLPDAKPTNWPADYGPAAASPE